MGKGLAEFRKRMHESKHKDDKRASNKHKEYKAYKAKREIKDIKDVS